jgi:hypothetical protein
LQITFSSDMKTRIKRNNISECLNSPQRKVDSLNTLQTQTETEPDTLLPLLLGKAFKGGHAIVEVGPENHTGIEKVSVSGLDMRQVGARGT